MGLIEAAPKNGPPLRNGLDSRIIELERRLFPFGNRDPVGGAAGPEPAQLPESKPCGDGGHEKRYPEEDKTTHGGYTGSLSSPAPDMLSPPVARR